MLHQFSDSQLVSLYQKQPNQEALEILLRRYRRLVRKISQSYYIIGSDYEDVYQEGLIGFYLSISAYNSAKNDSFSKFASLCIRRRILTAVEKSHRKKNEPLNQYESIYGSVGYGGYLFQGERYNPQTRLLDKEAYVELVDKIKDMLSKYELAILALRLNGDTYKEIACYLGVSLKAVETTLFRSRKKIAELVQDKKFA